MTDRPNGCHEICGIRTEFGARVTGDGYLINDRGCDWGADAAYLAARRLAKKLLALFLPCRDKFCIITINDFTESVVMQFGHEWRLSREEFLTWFDAPARALDYRAICEARRAR